MTEVVGFDLQIKGQDKTYKAFADQAKVMEAVANASKKVKGETELLEKAAERYANTAARKQADAAVKAAMGMQQQSAATNSLRANIDRLAQATGAQAAASDKLNLQLHRFTPAFSALGAAVSRVAPEIGGFSTAIGRAGGAIAGMTAVMGGPWGIAIGASVAAIGLLTEYLRNQTTAQERLTAAVEKGAKAYQMQQAAAQTAAEQRDPGFFANLPSSRSSEDARKSARAIADKIGEVERSRAAALRDAETAAAGVGAFGDVPAGYLPTGSTTVAKYDEQLAGLRRQAASEAQYIANREKFEKQQSAAPPLRVPTAKPKRAGEDPAIARGNAENAALFDEARNRSRLASQQLAERQANRFAGPEDYRSGFAESAKEARGMVAQEQKYRADAESIATRKLMVEEKRLADQRKKQAAEYKAIGIESYKAVGGAAIGAFVQMASGHKVHMKEVLAGLGAELIGLGTKWELEGGARVLFGDPSGAGLVGIGLAEIAAGIALGGAGGRSGRGGRGGGQRFASAAAAPGGGQQNSQTVVVHVHTQSVLKPDPYIGREIGRHVRAAANMGMQ